MNLDQTYPLIVAQYEITGHHRRTEHWNLTVLVSPNVSHTFEVRGNSDTFTYVHDTVSVPIGSIPSYRGGCHVGEVPSTSIDRLDERLKRDVAVIRLDLSWDCQDWVLAALRLLRDDGIAFKTVNQAYVRKELQEDMARWEEGDDTVEERHFSNSH